MNKCLCGCGQICKLRYVKGHNSYIPLADRFWPHVEKTETCWLWTGSKSKQGYGYIGGERSGPILKAHRVSWQLINGCIPEGMYILHDCPGEDNPSCVNPDHLFIGTHGDNMRDAAKKGKGYLQKHPEATRGEKHPMAKLTWGKVMEIREKGTNGVRQSNIAREYHVSRQEVGFILNNKHWKIPTN